MSALAADLKEQIAYNELTQPHTLAISSPLIIQAIEAYLKSHNLQPKDIIEDFNESNLDDMGSCRIDLHGGYSVQQAKERCIDIIKKTYSNENYQLIHIITGRGKHINSNGTKGVLFRNLQEWIQEPEISNLVREVKVGQGAYIIILNKEHKISRERPSHQLKESVLRKFANDGNKDAQFALGRRLFRAGSKESQIWFLKAAKQEHHQAMLMLGYCHAMGICAQYSIKDARRWYSRAAVASPDACINLGTMYWSGEAGKVDLEQVIYWYKQAEKLGSVKAQRLLGIVFNQLNRYDEAFFWNNKASDNNDLPAKVNLGCQYQKGLGVPKDEKKAVDLFRTAATGGIPEAKMRLGQAYLNNTGVDRDYKEAAKLFLEVGLANHDTVGSDCQFFLYKMYKEGLGFTPNPTIAEQWLQRAAKNKNTDALNFIELRNSIAVNEHGEVVLIFGVPADKVFQSLEESQDSTQAKEQFDVAPLPPPVSDITPSTQPKETATDRVNSNSATSLQPLTGAVDESNGLTKEESTNANNLNEVKKNTGFCPYFSRYVLLTSATVATVAISEYIRRNYTPN